LKSPDFAGNRDDPPRAREADSSTLRKQPDGNAPPNQLHAFRSAIVNADYGAQGSHITYEPQLDYRAVGEWGRKSVDHCDALESLTNYQKSIFMRFAVAARENSVGELRRACVEGGPNLRHLFCDV
jgi:hypothetical protein